MTQQRGIVEVGGLELKKDGRDVAAHLNGKAWPGHPAPIRAQKSTSGKKARMHTHSIDMAYTQHRQGITRPAARKPGWGPAAGRAAKSSAVPRSWKAGLFALAEMGGGDGRGGDAPGAFL